MIRRAELAGHFMRLSRCCNLHISQCCSQSLLLLVPFRASSFKPINQQSSSFRFPFVPPHYSQSIINLHLSNALSCLLFSANQSTIFIFQILQCHFQPFEGPLLEIPRGQGPFTLVYNWEGSSAYVTQTLHQHLSSSCAWLWCRALRCFGWKQTPGIAWLLVLLARLFRWDAVLSGLEDHFILLSSYPHW